MNESNFQSAYVFLSLAKADSGFLNRPKTWLRIGKKMAKEFDTGIPVNRRHRLNSRHTISDNAGKN